ncbi:MAG: CsbD family protein [Proteobacteria bacterium]|nr:MAG: CsbD family protein [Pseudomonadota bacterium]
MNKDTLEGSWTEMKGKAMKQWSKLTENDFTEFKGNLEELKGKVQKLYGYGKEQVEQEFGKFINKPVENANRKLDAVEEQNDQKAQDKNRLV